MLSDIQADSLRELGNIGAAHAATTLSTMLSAQIEMTVPDLKILDVSRIHEFIGDDPAAMVIFEIQGEIAGAGYILLLVPHESVIRLTNAMLGTNEERKGLTEMDQSALLEVGNIMASAFLDATAGLLGIMMLPSPPELIIDMPLAAVETLLASQAAGSISEVVLFFTELSSDRYRIDSNIFLLPNEGLLNELVRMLENLVNKP
ncbi:MAG: chemotaxis protein CheC [Methanoregulaceae archaeon]|jgi:chemotaxis protein CheC|nr:chemotaxis protein CheC [Methanoregulaceae archaeon]